MHIFVSFYFGYFLSYWYFCLFLFSFLCVFKRGVVLFLFCLFLRGDKNIKLDGYGARGGSRTIRGEENDHNILHVKNQVN